MDVVLCMEKKGLRNIIYLSINYEIIHLEEHMVADLFDSLDIDTGDFVKDNAHRIEQLVEKSNQIRDEFAKVSKHKLFGQSMQELLEVELYILDDTEEPKFKLFVYGSAREEVGRFVEEAIIDFIKEKQYAFHKFHNQLEWQFSYVIGEKLNKSLDKCEFWCSRADRSMSMFGVPIFLFYIIKFDKFRLDEAIIFKGKRHPLLRNLRIEWEHEFGKFFNMHKKINYNELFRRTSTHEHFLYYYQDDLNALSAMKYENEINRGSILALKVKRDDDFDDVVNNYHISLRLSRSVKITPENYKRIRKLLEISHDELSLLMNDQGEVFAIGTISENTNRTYYKICFINFLEWKFYVDGEEYLHFNNMLPSFPETGAGIHPKDIEKLIGTFGDGHLNKLKEIIEGAINQRHGTMLVFTENAEEEAKRLAISGIQINSTEMSKELIESATSIDGALICDEKGICYAIGTILDGEASDIGEPSRGARFNSALRYINKQKRNGKKTFIVVVSEDRYINCISTEVD